jgi:hypothetical protein
MSDIQQEVFLDDMLAGYDACRQISAETGGEPQSFTNACGVSQALQRFLKGSRVFVSHKLIVIDSRVFYATDENTERLVVWFDELIAKPRDEFERRLEEHFQFPVSIFLSKIQD